MSKISWKLFKTRQSHIYMWNIVNIFINYKINLLPFNVGKYFVLRNSLLGAVKVTKNVDPEECKYSNFDIGFDAHESFLLSDGSWFGKNVIKYFALTWARWCVLIIR